MTRVGEYLSDLIRIASPSAISNRPLIEYAAAALHRAGWSTRQLSYRDPAGVEKLNLLAAPPAQDLAATEPDLVFICHTDTVPYAADWAAALEPIVRDGMIHGCGACDVKGFLACLLAAISTVSPSAIRTSTRLILTADEEVGCIGASRLLAEADLNPRRLIVGEPTSLHPARAGKGYCLAEIAVYGREAHSAHPAQGVSAIAHAARLITAIEDLAARIARDEHPFFDPPFTTLNIGTIQGGTAKNIVPGLCRFLLEWRPIPGQSPDAVPEQVLQIITRFENASPGFEAELRVLRQQPGFETPADSPLVQALESLTGRPAVSIPFGSEASLFPLADELIVFGPGDMRTAHSSRECVPLAELDRAVDCIRSLLQFDGSRGARLG
jgi:acetylornithine deacetylase